MTKASRPGRPRLDPHGSTPVNVRLPSTQYDNLYALARQRDVSVPEVIRQLLARGHPRDDVDDDE